jgi:hypothetical protein
MGAGSKRIGVPAPHHGGGPASGEARDQGDMSLLKSAMRAILLVVGVGLLAPVLQVG